MADSPVDYVELVQLLTNVVLKKHHARGCQWEHGGICSCNVKECAEAIVEFLVQRAREQALPNVKGMLLR